MSKKQSEFDRYDRMIKLSREASAEKRKNADNLSDYSGMKEGKPKSLKKSDRSKQDYDYYFSDFPEEEQNFAYEQ